VKFGVYKVLCFDQQTLTMDDVSGLDNARKYKPIIKLSSVSSMSQEIKGCLLISEPGLYKVVFDNTYSYLRAKELLYRVHLLSRDSSMLI